MASDDDSTSSRNRQLQNFKKFGTNFFSGGTAGAISKTVVAPIERVKLLLQVQDASTHIAPDKRYKGILDTLVRVPKEQGVLSFWRGNLTSVVRYFPYQALNFGFNNFYKDTFLKGKANKSFVGSLVCGGAAGVTSSFFTYSLDFARTRLALDIGRTRSSREFTGLWDCLVKIWRADGVRGLYRGFFVSVWAYFVYRASYFGCFYQAQAFFASGNDAKQLHFLHNWAIAQVITPLSGMIAYPFDTVRRHMMMQSGAREQAIYSSSWDCATKIARNHGVRAFYNGAFTNIFRSVGGALVLAIYEEIGKYTH